MSTKPKGNPHRWVRVGDCCEKCFNSGV